MVLFVKFVARRQRNRSKEQGDNRSNAFENRFVVIVSRDRSSQALRLLTDVACDAMGTKDEQS